MFLHFVKERRRFFEAKPSLLTKLQGCLQCNAKMDNNWLENFQIKNREIKIIR
jgi:hypothetical protein